MALLNEWEIISTDCPPGALCTEQSLFTAAPSAASPRGKFAEMLGDDDAIGEVLQQCHLETLWTIRYVSSEWFSAVQHVLCSAAWRGRQITLDLHLLVRRDSRSSAEMLTARWPDIATIALEMPQLQQLVLNGFHISLRRLRTDVSMLDRATLHHATLNNRFDDPRWVRSDRVSLEPVRRGTDWGWIPSSWDSFSDTHRFTDMRRGMMHSRVCLQLVATIHTIANSDRLLRVDLSGLLPSYMPADLAHTLASVVRSAPKLQQLVLVNFCIPVGFLRGGLTTADDTLPSFDYWSHDWSTGTAPMTVSSWKFGKKGLVVADLIVMCEGGGLLENVSEIDISRNDLSDAGASVLVSCVNSRRGLLDNLRILILDQNHIGDSGCLSLCHALCGGAFPLIEHLGLYQNLISDVGCARIPLRCANPPAL